TGPFQARASDKQVQPAIVVVVSPGTRCGSTRFADDRANFIRAHAAERPISIISPKEITGRHTCLTSHRDKQIEIAVVVIIAPGDSTGAARIALPVVVDDIPDVVRGHSLEGAVPF